MPTPTADAESGSHRVSSFDLMDHTSDLALVIDGQDCLQSASRSAEQTLGRCPQELRGRPWQELLHPDDRATVGRAIAVGSPAEQRLRLLDADGFARWFELIAAPALDDGDGGGRVLILRDVHHELEVERLGALLQRLTRLANETADLPTVLQQAVGDICSTMSWPSGRAFAGTDDAAGLGEGGDGSEGSAPGAVPPELATPVGAAVRDRATRSGRPAWEVADLGDGPQLVTAVPVRTQDGTAAVLCFAGYAEPVSETLLGVLENVGLQLGMVAARQADREALEERDAELRRSNEELERFAYVASHDLQEPLRKVVTACELLERRVGPELAAAGGDRYVDIAVDAARRMQLLIRDLLAYSRIGRGNIEPAAPVDLGDLVAEVCQQLSQAIEESGASVDVGPLPRVPVGRDELRQVFANLISNAVKFRGSAPPRIDVAAQVHDGEVEHVEVTVCDNGIGIEPEYAERIFDVFRRLHRQDEYEGTGIGLAIAKRIIEHHGGTIWVTSRPDGGSCFHLTLPSGPTT